MGAHYDVGAFSRARIGGHSRSQTGRLERGTLARHPVVGAAVLVTGGEIDEHHIVAAPDCLECDITHEQLPVVLVRDEKHVGWAAERGLRWE